MAKSKGPWLNPRILEFQQIHIHPTFPTMISQRSQIHEKTIRTRMGTEWEQASLGDLTETGWEAWGRKMERECFNGVHLDSLRFVPRSLIYQWDIPIFPESASEGFLLCTSSAGVELCFPGACRRGAAAVPARCRRGAGAVPPRCRRESAV